MKSYTIYTDGSSKGNPGPGGWAAVIVGVLRQAQGDFVTEIGGREEKTTNNRMEMKAIIEALKILPSETQVEIHTDSEYLLKGATIWIKDWQKNGWKTKNKKPVLNQDLWKSLVGEIEKRKVNWQKVTGHSGHKFNDRCDGIATEFASGKKVTLYYGPFEKYKI